MEEKFIKTGRIFYSISMLTMGVNQLVWGDFRTVILPAWPTWRVEHPAIPAYLTALLLIVGGVLIIFSKKGKEVALVWGSTLLVILLCWHLPYILFIQPHEIRHFGVWAEASKALALCGGAFVTAGSFVDSEEIHTYTSRWKKLLQRIIPLGPVFFCITMIEYGIDHFLYADGIATLVPSWIPMPVFWTYFAGAMLIGSGVAIILKIKLKLVALLQAAMIFIWFLILHIPRAITDSQSMKGNEVVSAADALAFCGIGLMIALCAKFKRSEFREI